MKRNNKNVMVVRICKDKNHFIKIVDDRYIHFIGNPNLRYEVEEFELSGKSKCNCALLYSFIIKRRNPDVMRILDLSNENLPYRKNSRFVNFLRAIKSVRIERKEILSEVEKSKKRFVDDVKAARIKLARRAIVRLFKKLYGVGDVLLKINFFDKSSLPAPAVEFNKTYFTMSSANDNSPVFGVKKYLKMYLYEDWIRDVYLNRRSVYGDKLVLHVDDEFNRVYYLDIFKPGGFVVCCNKNVD